MKKKLIPKVKYLNELRNLAESDPRYQELAMISASNLGGSPKDLDGAMNWLFTNALETDEEGVIGEINFCRDLVKSS